MAEFKRDHRDEAEEALPGAAQGGPDLAQRALAALVAAGDMAYAWDLVSDTIRWSGANDVFQHLGGPEGLGTGRSLLDRLHPEDRRRRQDRLQQHLTGRSDFDCEYRIHMDDGTIAWVHDRGSAAPSASGKSKKMAGIWRFITDRKAAEQKLQQFVDYDELTGHFNHKRLREALDFVVASSLRSRNSGAYFAVGVDKLALVNDAFGDQIGDAVIVEIGRRLEQCLRSSDLIGRAGGDRFGVVLVDCEEENIAVAAERIRAAVNQGPIITAMGPVYATVSIGAATFPEQAKTSYEVMNRADLALADAKRAGRDCFVPYQMSDEQRQLQRLGMAMGERVQRALKENRLVFAYQPVVNSGSGEVDYYECLIRMIGEDGELVSAADFIPVIEQLGFVRTVDRYVLEQAVAQVAANPGITLGFNISGLTAMDRSWLRAITRLLRDRPELARQLVVEITETAALSDIEESARFVATLRDLGCRVAIDDFGAGFTSLRHLQALNVDTVKIDGSFVRDLADSFEKQVFLRHLVGLANGFGFTTVAEGVESAQEAAILRREGVSLLQGYYFAKPSIELPWARPAAE